MQFLFTTPVNRPLGDVPVSGVRVNVFLDLDNSQLNCMVSLIEDPLKNKTVQLALTPTQVTNFTSAIKTLLASALGVTFQ